MLETSFREATCPACGHHVAVSFFDGGNQPLATLAWPESFDDARNLPPLPLDFVCCVDCGHVFNSAFSYDRVPYSKKPNRMFNQAAKWSVFLEETQDRILKHLGPTPTVIEVGHGDGTFLAALAQRRPGGRFIGFDPHGAEDAVRGVELRAELFDPARHLAEFRPDMVISRHVLEHLANPLGFLQAASFAASCIDLEPIAYFEVPCIDNVFAAGRTVDFYYEHSSHFTTRSFERMLSRSSREVLEVGHGYGNEVVFGFARLGGYSRRKSLAMRAMSFEAAAAKSLQTISRQLDDLHRSGNSVAIWGGTGKSAAFMCRYHVDAARFPIVVDSDRTKVGTFVPGTGQEIRSRDALVEIKVDVLIIPPQWRAADILAEMGSAGISVERVLIEHRGELIDFHKGEHPYKP